MRYMRVGAPGAEIPVVLTKDGRHLDLRALTADVDGSFFSGDGLARTKAAVAAGRLPELDVTGLRIGPPIARPGVVLCIGMNYAAHAAESNSPTPSHPVMFYKAPNTVVGPNDDVLLPHGSAKTDWEVELGVVIGRRVRYLESPTQALDYVAGAEIRQSQEHDGILAQRPAAV